MKDERATLIGNEIKQCRLERGLTQAQLAEKLNVKYQTVQAWERGLRTPKLETREKIALALDVNLSRLLALDERGAGALLGYDSDLYTHDEEELIGYYRMLNSVGKKKVSTYAEDLTDLPQYTVPDKPISNK